MRKYSLPVRAAALLCAVCLLLTGCGQVAAPDDSGEPGAPASTAEPAAEETKSAIDDLGLTDVEKLAAQLAAKHLGQDTVLTDVVEFSSDDFGPATYHVLLLKDTGGNYLAYRYGTGSVYCLSEEEAQNNNNKYLDSEEDVCTYLLYSLSHRTQIYLNDHETVTKLTPSELEEVNLALARGEVLADFAEEAQAAREEQEAARKEAQAAQEELGAAQEEARAAREEQEAAQLAAQLTAEYLGEDTKLTQALDFSLHDFGHVLLLKDIKNNYLAYSYDTGAVYSATSNDLLHFKGSLHNGNMEEDRCLSLLREFLNRSDNDDNDAYPYVNRDEIRTELTESELAQVNQALAQGDIPVADMEEVEAAQKKQEAAQRKLEAAQKKLEAVQDVLTAQEELGAAELTAQLAAEHWGQDAVLTDVVDYSVFVDGLPRHVLMLRSATDEFLAYSYNTKSVYSPRSDDVINYNGDGDLSTDEGRCAYLLWSFFCHTGVYWDDEETLTELTAAEVAKVNQALALGLVPVAEETETLPADAALPEGSGAYRVLDECPEEFSRRELSDEEILSLAQEGDLEKARERISTGGDFAAWLVALGGQFHSNTNTDGEKQKTIGAAFAFDWVGQIIDSTAAAALAVRVLEDDLPGISIVAARVAENDGTFLCGNLIPAEDGGYYLVSFDSLTDEWKAAVESETNWIVPEAFLPIWVDGYAGITAWCQSADNPRGSTLTQAFYIPGDQEVVLDYKDELYTPQSPWGIQEFYRNKALAAASAEQRVAYINPEYIRNYLLSTKLGGTTLTPEEAYALLDMEPEQVKERVKTAADVLMLMLAGRYGDTGGDRTKVINGQEWHYNINAFQVMETRTTNCGSAANLANYLLEGDYEEVGFIEQAYYVGNGGGHIYNYFKYQGKYYIVDFSWYMFNGYQPGRDFPVMEAGRLEDFGRPLAELYGGVCLVLAHTSPGQHYPIVYDDQNKAHAIPEGVEYTLLYQVTASNAYTVAEYPLDRSQLDWTTFGEP